MILNDEAAHCAVFQPPITSFLLGSKIPPQHALLEISQSVFVLNVTNQISYLHKISKYLFYVF